MIKVIFKDVGQGDSIIFEWKDNKQNKIAVIDCNIHQKSNPVLDYIIEKRYKTIEYLILSHPHYDHFSGFYDLLEYCNDNNIWIKYFLHTSSQVPTFLKMACNSVTSATELQKLFLFIHNNSEVMNMQYGSIQADVPNNTIRLNNDYSFTILSPSQKELKSYIKNAAYPYFEENPHDNPKANLLSTVIKVNLPTGYILLTSDADKSSLIRIDKKQSDLIKSTLLLGQSPHHGAQANHNNTFWKKRARNSQTPIVFSVGHNHYGHPAGRTVNFFIENDYKIYSTNKVGGLQEKENKEVLIALDMFSSKTVNKQDDLQGDKTFCIG